MADCCAVCYLPLGPFDRLVVDRGLMFCSEHAPVEIVEGAEQYGLTSGDEALLRQAKQFDDSSWLRMRIMADEMSALERQLRLPVPPPPPIGWLEEFSAA